MTRALLPFLAAIALLAACSQDQGDADREEMIEFQLLASLQGALVYDEICNGGQMVRGRNANLLGNLQMVPGRAIRALANNNHDIDADTLGARMSESAKKMEARMKARLQAQGCGSRTGEEMRMSLDFFAGTPPEAVYGMTERRLDAEGVERAPPSPALDR